MEPPIVRNPHVRAGRSATPTPTAGSRAAAVARLDAVFRAHGFEGASLAAITAATGLGKGSLYNLFPGGKEEMAAAVLAEEAAWFRDSVFTPLRQAPDPRLGIAHMLDALAGHYREGRRACLMGVFATGAARDRFVDRLDGFFADWTATLAEALGWMGRPPAAAQALADEAVAQIEGALVLACARNDPGIFTDALARLRKRLA